MKTTKHRQGGGHTDHQRAYGHSPSPETPEMDRERVEPPSDTSGGQDDDQAEEEEVQKGDTPDYNQLGRRILEGSGRTRRYTTQAGF